MSSKIINLLTRIRHIPYLHSKLEGRVLELEQQIAQMQQSMHHSFRGLNNTTSNLRGRLASYSAHYRNLNQLYKSGEISREDYDGLLEKVLGDLDPDKYREVELAEKLGLRKAEFIYNREEVVFYSHDPQVFEAYYAKGKFYESEMLEFILENETLTGTVLDIGSFIGNHSVFLSKFSEACEIHAFEPVNYNVLEKNVEANFCNNVVLHKYGISDVASRVSCRTADNFGGTHLTTDEAGEIELKVIDELGLSNVRLMKIDVEGYEMKVLDGARKTIERDRPSIYVEIKDNLEEYDAWFESVGYKRLERFNLTPTYRYRLVGER